MVMSSSFGQISTEIRQQLIYVRIAAHTSIMETPTTVASLSFGLGLVDCRKTNLLLVNRTRTGDYYVVSAARALLPQCLQRMCVVGWPENDTGGMVWERSIQRGPFDI